MKIDWNCKEDEKIVLAVSGGVDSVCLLDMAVKHSKLPRENIIVAHLDHGMRVDSADDMEFVKKLAQEYGVWFEGKRIVIDPNEGNVEARAREERYAYLEEVRFKAEADWILTAHHRDDQAETVLMKFLKGTFIKGMRGMQPKDYERKICRPLIKMAKSELEEYARENGLDFRIDSTNKDQSFTRNYLRRTVLPFLEEKFTGFSDRLASNSEYYFELDVYLESKVFEWINDSIKHNIGGRTFEVSQFFVQPNFFKFLIISKLLEVDLSQADFEEINKLICESKPGSERKVGEYNLYVGPDEILVSKLDVEEIADMVFDEYKIEGRKLRTYKEGDKYLFGDADKPKKLKDYFVKNKIPWYYRRGLPLVVDENDVVTGVVPYEY